ncbi:hypothetical protein L1049_025612 [Liquidambar formosana]|uniref:J domain-containing protein n=1 Tax=Liquidambar formosana TaxID=63359 RepID=A0AAP0NEX5_LIQFO
MVSTTSLPSLSSSPHLLGRKMAVNAPPLQPRRIGFRPIRISAVHATAERVTSHIASANSLYEVLGVHADATCQEIKAAYRRLARVSHPDVASNGRKDASAAAFMKIHSAYATLSDPEKRADYDRTIFRRQRPLSSPFGMSPSMAGSSDSVFSGMYTGRNWETDQCW